MNKCSTIHTLSRLPLELWFTIFNFATNVPGLLSSDGPAPSDLPRSLVKKQELRLLKESLFTKRNIVCVCKTWHVLATEFLYRRSPLVLDTWITVTLDFANAVFNAGVCLQLECREYRSFKSRATSSGCWCGNWSLSTLHYLYFPTTFILMKIYRPCVKKMENVVTDSERWQWLNCGYESCV